MSEVRIACVVWHSQPLTYRIVGKEYAHLADIFKTKITGVPWSHDTEEWCNVRSFTVDKIKDDIKSSYYSSAYAFRTPLIIQILWCVRHDDGVELVNMERVFPISDQLTYHSIITMLTEKHTFNGISHAFTSEKQTVYLKAARKRKPDFGVRFIKDLGKDRMDTMIAKFVWVALRSTQFQFLSCYFGIKWLLPRPKTVLVEMMDMLLKTPYLYCFPFPLPGKTLFEIDHNEEPLSTERASQIQRMIGPHDFTPQEYHDVRTQLEVYGSSTCFAVRESSAVFEHMLEEGIIHKVNTSLEPMYTFPALLHVTCIIAGFLSTHIRHSDDPNPLNVLLLRNGFEEDALVNRLESMFREDTLVYAPSTSAARQYFRITGTQATTINTNRGSPVQHAKTMIFHRADWATERQIMCFLGFMASGARAETIIFTGDMCTHPGMRYSGQFLQDLLQSKLAKTYDIPTTPTRVPRVVQCKMDTPIPPLLGKILVDFVRNSSNQKIILATTYKMTNAVNTFLQGTLYGSPYSISEGSRVMIAHKNEYATIKSMKVFHEPEEVTSAGHINMVEEATLVFDFYAKSRVGVLNTALFPLTMAYCVPIYHFRACDMKHIMILKDRACDDATPYLANDGMVTHVVEREDFPPVGPRSQNSTMMRKALNVIECFPGTDISAEQMSQFLKS
jgi:hypothetical protein